MPPRKSTTSSTKTFNTGRFPEAQPVENEVSATTKRNPVQAAMAFIRRGRPEAELAIDETCPKTTADDWKDAERVAIKFDDARASTPPPRPGVDKKTGPYSRGGRRAK